TSLNRLAESVPSRGIQRKFSTKPVKRIEIGANRRQDKGIYIFYVVGLLGLINIKSIGLGPTLCWVAGWCLVGFLVDKFRQYKSNKFKIIFDDSGVEVMDWMSHYQLPWEDLRVEEVVVHTQHSRSASSPVGKTVISHGGDPGTAVEQKSGSQP